MANTLPMGSTVNVTITGLHVNTTPRTYPIDATVIIVELLDDAGAAVAGVSNISCPYVSGTGSSSIYQGPIPSTVSLTEGVVYSAHVRATSGSNVRAWWEPVTAVKAA